MKFINFESTLKVSAKPICIGDEKVIAPLVGLSGDCAKYIGQFSIYPIIYDDKLQQYIAPEGITVATTTTVLPTGVNVDAIVQDIYNDIRTCILPDQDVSAAKVYSITIDNIVINLKYDDHQLIVDYSKYFSNNTMLLCSSVKYEIRDSGLFMDISKLDTCDNEYVDCRGFDLSGLKINVAAHE